MVAHDVRPPHLPAELLLLRHVGLARVPVGSVADERVDIDVDHQHEEVHRGEPEEAEENRTAPVPAQRLRLRRDREHARSDATKEKQAQPVVSGIRAGRSTEPIPSDTRAEQATRSHDGKKDWLGVSVAYRC